MVEEEPEGEIVAGPSGEATIHDSGIILTHMVIYVFVNIYTFK